MHSVPVSRRLAGVNGFIPTHVRSQVLHGEVSIFGAYAFVRDAAQRFATTSA